MTLPDTTVPDTSVPLRTSRRLLLRHGGIAALALGGGALSGCSQQPSGEPEPTSGTGEGVPGSDTPSAPEPSEGGAPTGLSLAAATVPVGGGVVLEDADYVVTQPTAGEYRAFSKICTHQGCAVSEVAEGQITCFCHGSVFSGGDGSVLQGPAEQPLPETPVTVEGGRLLIG